MIENCPMRHENGNCIPAGGFCTANKNICEALRNAYRMGKEQLSKEGTTKGATSDLISRTETVEHLRRVLEATVPNTDYDEGYIDGIEFAISTVSTMPTIQPVATDTNVGAAISKFIDGLEEIFADLRERHVDDSVCGLCEYDGAYMGQSGDWCNECPGFDRDDCFKLSDKTRKEWTDEIIKALPTIQPEVLACGNGELVAQPEPTDIDAKEAVYNLAEKIGIHQLFALTVELRGEPIQPELTYEQVEEYCKKRCLHVVTADFFESTKPQRLGHWVDGRCNECGGQAPFWVMASTYYESDFCPHCGTKMKGERQK